MDANKLANLLKKYPAKLHGDSGVHFFSCPVRLTFVSLDKKQAPRGTQKVPRYNVVGIVPNGASIDAIDAASKKAWSLVGLGRAPQRKPLKDQKAQFEKKRDGFGETGVFFQAESNDVPQIFNADLSPADVSKIYNGCWAVLKCKAEGYNVAGNDGVKFWLSAIQFLADDEGLKVGNAADGFEAHGDGAPAGSAPAQTPKGDAALAW